MKFRTFSILTAILLSLSLSAQTTETYNLNIQVVDIVMIRGKICVAIYDSAAGMKSKQPVKKIAVPVTKRNEQLDVQLSGGDYAVMLVQDLNGNQKMDSFLTLPLEPYGVSNNHGGYPSFEMAHFELKENRSIVIKLNN